MDEKWMRLALELAKKGEGFVNPNPLVGAVIVKNEKVIGRGYHTKFGYPHAEVEAFKNAEESVEGATLYVTLEPCSHYGKTPPCADLIVKKKIKRVVVGILDPNPLVAGRGIKKLVDEGIEVAVGVLEEECRKINEVFLKYIVNKEPFVLIKSAVSLDGKIATSKGESKWISGEESRARVHASRGKYAAIMAGINTVLEDNPYLTCRVEGKKSPVRVIVDSFLKIPLDSNIVRTADSVPVIVACTKKADVMKKEKLIKTGVNILEIDGIDSRVDLKKLVLKLGEMNIDSILIEGGGTLNFSALSQGIVDKVQFYVAPKIIGGVHSKTSVEGLGIDRLKDSFNVSFSEVSRVGEDILIEGYIKKGN